MVEVVILEHLIPEMNTGLERALEKDIKRIGLLEVPEDCDAIGIAVYEAGTSSDALGL